VPEQSQRTLLAPMRLGWVSSEQSSDQLPSAIALGGPASGRVVIYMEFPEPEPGRTLVRAELWLGLASTATVPIEVEISRAERPERPLRKWSDQPQARYPRLAAELGARRSERLDVSDLVNAPRKAGEPLTVLLRSEPDGPAEVLLETGASSGRAPRLDLYWE
jgi:hypothetical protein